MCHWTENAALLLVWRYHQHRLAYGVPRLRYTVLYACSFHFTNVVEHKLINRFAQAFRICIKKISFYLAKPALTAEVVGLKARNYARFQQFTGRFWREGITCMWKPSTHNCLARARKRVICLALRESLRDLLNFAQCSAIFSLASDYSLLLIFGRTIGTCVDYILTFFGSWKKFIEKLFLLGREAIQRVSQ